MIRIPTGPVSKNTARNVSFALGLLSPVASFFAPQYSELIRTLGVGATGLGLTLGKAEGT